MFSVSTFLALALIVQAATPEPPIATAPGAAPAAAADDPIGALVDAAAADNGEGEDGIVAAPPASAAATPPERPLPETPLPETQVGPRPYLSLKPQVGGVRPIRPLPLVRLPSRPSGSLDGGWVLAPAASGGLMFQFQFNDEGGGAEIEGAWRDLRRPAVETGSGPVASVSYEGAGVVIRFYEAGAREMSVVSLQPAPGGTWTGQMQGGSGLTPVIMRRN